MSHNHLSQTLHRNRSKPNLTSHSQLHQKTELPPGWDLARIQRTLKVYDSQHRPSLKNHSQPMPKNLSQNMIEVPEALVPAVLEMIEKHKAA